MLVALRMLVAGGLVAAGISGDVRAETSPYAGMQNRGLKALSRQEAPVAGIEAILKYLGWFRHAGSGATPPSTPAGRDCPHPRRLLAFARGGACTFRGGNGSRTGGGSMRSSRPTLRGTRVRT
jgi:hypothetical protein